MSSTQLRHALRLVAVLACLVAALPASPLRAGFSSAPLAGLVRQASSSHSAATSSPTAAAGGAPSCPPPWQTLPSPRLGLSSALFGVAGSAADDVWAVGATVATGQHERPLLLHWDGRRWLPILVPISSGRLYAVAAVRHDDAWAVGATLDSRGGHSTPLLLHWNGLDWRIVAGPALLAGRGYALRGLAALSASDIWAVGGADGGTQTLIEHYDGQQWSVTPSPNGGAGASLQAVSAASPTDVWAVGTHISSEAYPLVERWDGHRWSAVSTPLDATAGSLSAVVARAAGDVWVAGAADDIGGGGALAAHWDGRAWHTVSVPDGGDYEALAAIAAGDVWGVGASGVIEHYDGASWQITLDASAAAAPPSSPQPHAARPRIASRAMSGRIPQGALVVRTMQSVRPHSSSGSPPVGSYSIVDLGSLSSGMYSYGYGANAIGQVAGYSYASDRLNHAFRTGALNPINPATDQLDAQIGIGSSSDGYGLNDLGQAVGEVSFPASNRPAAAISNGIAFRTAPNSLINPQTDDLGTLGGSTSVAHGINNAGQVVGEAQNSQGVYHAFRTEPNQPINVSTDDLGTLGGSDSYASGINISGQVVGNAQTGQGVYHAFRTAPNSPINPQTDDLGTLGGSDSYANGINSAGQVVGYAQTSLGVDHAFLTGPNQSINPGTDDLGTLPGDAFSYANGVNDSGQVVGTSVSDSESSRAFLWQNGQMIDLNTLLPPGSGWSLTVAQSINDPGQITGYGSIGSQTHAFLMVPTSYNGLAAAYNNAGTTDDSGTGLASFDGGHASYSAQALAAAGIVPGGAVSSGGMTFQWPSPQPPSLNNVIAQGQTIDVNPPAGGQTLSFLGAASNGATSGIGTITYSDGSTQSFNLGFSDWTLGGGGGGPSFGGGGIGPSFGNTIVATLPYRNLYGSGPENVSTYLFGATVTLDPSKVVTSVTLPLPQPLNQGQLHIFAMAITAPQIRITPSSLDFGSVADGTTSQAQTVTIANVGTATLSISSIATSGPHGGDFTVSGDTCSGQAIATGGSCSVNVSFTPSISGTETASLSISDNVAGSPQSVSLTGVGVQPPTAVPTTAVPTTAVPTTAVPTTAVPTTAVPTTAVPTTAVPPPHTPTLIPPTHTPTPIPPTRTPTLLAPTHTPTTRPTDTPAPPTAGGAQSSTPTPTSTSVPTVLPLATPDAPDAAGYPDALLALAVLAPGDVWAVGSHYQPDASGRAQVPLILHYAGGGLCTAAPPASRSVAVTGQPGALSVDEQAGRSFVRNADGTLSVLDSAHDTLVRTVSVGGAAGAPLVVDAQAGRVIAADPGSGGVRGSVSILDAHSGRVVATITHGLQHPVAIALDASSGRAFVVDMGPAGGHGAGSVTTLNVSTGAVVGRIPVGRAPTQALVDGSRRRVYVLNAGDGTVSTLDAARGRRLRTTAVGDLSTTAPGATALDARRGLLYVGHTLKHGLMAAVGVLNERTGVVRQSNLRACQANDAPRAIGADTRAGRVFVACDRVYVLDAGGKVLRSVDVGAVPNAIAVDEQKGLVFVTALAHVNSSDDPNGPGLLSVLNARNGRLLATAPVGWGPVAVLVDTKRK